jgi:hypothetical protein
MRSPWIDLLFLHGHLAPAPLAWRPDAGSCAAATSRIEVDVAQLPLADRREPRACACDA